VVVYDFNPLSPLDLLPLSDTTSLIHNERLFIIKFVRKFDEKVNDQIERKTHKYIEYNNKRQENNF